MTDGDHGEARKSGAKGVAESIELTRAEQTAARRAAESKATIPHLYLAATAPAVAEGRTATAAVAKALADALRETPRLNSSYRDGALEVHSRVNIGVGALAGQDALVPTVFDADEKPVEEIEAEIARLEEIVAEGRATARDLAGATATIYDMSAGAITSIGPTLVPGQAVALGAGVEGGALRLTLACDGRVAGAARAAAFLASVAERTATTANERG